MLPMCEKMANLTENLIQFLEVLQSHLFIGKPSLKDLNASGFYFVPFLSLGGVNFENYIEILAGRGR